MKFSIITPTHNRPTLLLRALESVTGQTYSNWELIIINDDPHTDLNLELTSYVQDTRVHLLQNTENSGVNFSRNRGLDAIAPDSDYVIFLDDDDHLTPVALANIADVIKRVSCHWLLTNRGTSAAQATTYAPKNNAYYGYAWDYLITKKIKGDATHAIDSRYINGVYARIRFATRIKQAEEWLFYLALSDKSDLYYTDIVTTITDGYASSGLNMRKRSIFEQLSRIPVFIRESFSYGLYKMTAFWIYCGIRFARSFIR